MEKRNMENRLIVIAGPTAVGKSDVAVKLAKELGTEVISADSMQVYRGMDIGTAKVTELEMQGVPHSLINCFDPREDYNVTIFQAMARKEIERIQSKGKIPILCGGTGFYIQALIYGIDFAAEENDSTIRDSLLKQVQEEGIDSVYEQLKCVDPDYAAATPKENIKRIVRALEFFKMHGERFSDHNRQEALKRREPLYDTKIFILYDDREALFERINSRVDRMIAGGLEQEVKRLIDSGVPETATSMQGIGYKQFIRAFQGLCSRQQAIEQIKIDSRHYAKRQLTWFKTQEPNAVWIKVGEGDTVERIKQHLW